ncbi:MAG: chemotaxis protein CheA, partial [Rhodothermales bacterium]
ADLEAISEGTYCADEAAPASTEEETVAEAPVSPPDVNAEEDAQGGTPAKAEQPVSKKEDPADEASKQSGTVRRTRHAETIRVEVERLDSLMDLVGELVLGRNRLLQIVSDLKTTRDTDDLLRELADTNSQVDFITTELQTAVMHTRMVQIGRVFNKFPRVVRDLAKEFNKKVDLIIEGEETELDKSLVEEISDPLVHLIRNAADHGIEQPDVRMAAGKPARGQIRLTAAHEGNHVVIEIEDDGAGINVEKVKQKALEKGLVTEKEAAEMSRSQAFELVLQPGFSTAQQVSQVSGRGVGMDVVKTNISRLNGTIDIDSTEGKGTRFTLKLPLTLAIIQSLLVRVGANETFAIPLHSVVEVVGLNKDVVSTIRGREVIQLREQVLPLLRVGEVLNVEGYERSSDRSFAVIVGIAHHRLGLVVDALTGQKEIVIKPLGSYLKKVSGIAGSTILGDGRVVMILDVGELIRMETNKRRSSRTPRAEAA